jgi:hypothetical protein
MSENHLGVPSNRSYQSKVGQMNDFGVVAEQLIRVNPPIYSVRCSICDARTNVSHQRF